MGLRPLLFIVAVVLVTEVWSFQSWEGDHTRADRAVPGVKIVAADTEADSDSKGKDGMASSSSSTKGSAAFISRYPHPDIHHHDEKADHFRSERSVDAVKIAVADTDAKSDSKAGHGMAASQSSTKGSAAFVSKNHQAKHRRSARSVEIAVADTDAKSDSKADHGTASSSSSTKGGAAFVSKHHHDKPRRSARDVKIAAAETDAVSDSKAKDGVAHSSSASKGSAAFVSKGSHHEEKEVPHDQPKEEKDEMEVAVEVPEDHEDKHEEMHREDKEAIAREPFVDINLVKKKINKLVKDSVDF